MKDKKSKAIYTYNEIRYNKGYDLSKEEFFQLAQELNLRPTLELSTETVKSFLDAVITYNNSKDIYIDEAELTNSVMKSLLCEAPVFGVTINYDALVELFKKTDVDDFIAYLKNLREAISLCMLNEIGKNRIEIEFSLNPNDETIAKKCKDFEITMNKLFEFKHSENKNYIGLDNELDIYLEKNLLNLQKNIVSGKPFEVAEKMLQKTLI